MGRVTDVRSTWGPELFISVHNRRMSVWGATEEQRKIVENTFSILPSAHVELVPFVVIGDTVGPASRPIETGGASIERNHVMVRMDIASRAFTPSKIKTVRGKEALLTIGHETGHFVDKKLHIQGRLRVNNTIDEKRMMCEWLFGNRYRGRTDYNSSPYRGLGEAVAEAYWKIQFGIQIPQSIQRLILSKL